MRMIKKKRHEILNFFLLFFQLVVAIVVDRYRRSLYRRRRSDRRRRRSDRYRRDCYNRHNK